MRTRWTVAILLSSVLIVGCGDRGAENARSLDEHIVPPPATAPAETNAADEALAPSPTDDTIARGDRPPETRARLSTPAVATAADAPRAAAPASQSPVPPVEETTRAETDPAVPAAPQWYDMTVPSGTALPLELTTALSSETAKVETPVRARLQRP